MTFEAFKASLKDAQPPEGISATLKALWQDGHGNWDKAHDLAQETGGTEGAWIHAYLHRKEGDAGNASYWYHRAGKPMPGGSLEQEWEQIARALL